MPKKISKVYIWLAVDRNANQVVDFEISRNGGFVAYLPLAKRLEKKYKIKILCTDGYEVYQQYQIAERHIITKAETSYTNSHL